MNPVQIAIIAGVVIIILLTLIYYWYDDIKFKRKVENNFNQMTKDVLQQEQPLVLDSIDRGIEPIAILQKDVHFDNDPLLGNAKPIHKIMPKSIEEPTHVFEHNVENMPLEIVEEVPEDSVEAFFVKLDKLEFPYTKEINHDLDLVIDIVFEEPKKLKVLPDITQYTHKYFTFYVLNKDNQWQVFEKGPKHTLNALKLVIQLVDKEGVINQAQIANIYNELHKFVISNDAHIRCCDYEAKIERIQEQIKPLNNIELVLGLYLLLKDKQPIQTLNKFMLNYGGVNEQGIFIFGNKITPIFIISDENGNELEAGKEYNLLAIEAKLHLHANPLEIVDKIFDFSEHFMTQFESRVLSTNKQVLMQKDYDRLYSHVKNYAESAARKHILLGSALIKRLFA